MSATDRERIRRKAMAKTARDLRAEAGRNGQQITQTQALARVQQSERKRQNRD